MTTPFAFRKTTSTKNQVTPVENFFGTENRAKADVTFLGIPLSTTQLTFGVELFPAFLRKATAKYSDLQRFYETGLYSELLTKPSPLAFGQGVSVADAGDLNVEGETQKSLVKALTSFWGEIRAKKSKPFFVGGDHAVTYLILKGLGAYEPEELKDLTILHFDAHNDFLNQQSISLHHASPIYNCVRELGVKKVHSFGVRTLTDSRVLNRYDDRAEEDLQLFLERVELHTPLEVARMTQEFAEGRGPVSSLKQGKPKAYLTIDLDVLSANEIGSAVSVPLDGGITWEQLYLMILRLRSEYDIIGCDLVEGSVFGYDNQMRFKKTLLLMVILLDVLKHPKTNHIHESYR